MELLARDVFENHVRHALEFVGLEHAGDMGMVEQCADACLVAKHLDHARVLGQVGLEPLDHDALFEPDRGARASQVDLGHATERQAFVDGVALRRDHAGSCLLAASAFAVVSMAARALGGMASAPGSDDSPSALVNGRLRRVGGERVENGQDARTQTTEIVAAFQGAYDPPVAKLVGGGDQASGHVRIARGGHFHPGQGIGLMGVEPRRDQDELGSKSPQFGNDDSVENRRVFAVATAARQTDVDRRSPALAAADLGTRAGAGIKRILVAGHEEDRGIALERVLRAVAVVNVPVDHRKRATDRLRVRRPRRSRRC